MAAALSIQEAKSPELNGVIKDDDHQLPLSTGRTRTSKFALYVPTTPASQPRYDNSASIFLAGSIEMGKAIQWQTHLTNELHDLEVTVCNPRRGQWSTNLNPGEMDDLFKHQVEWELSALEAVDVIVFFFDKNTLSPVTMLELGLWAQSGKVVVCCHKDFWKSGNIHYVCKNYNVPYVKDYADLIPLVRQRLDDARKMNQLKTKNADVSTLIDGELVKDTQALAEKLKRERETMVNKAKEGSEGEGLSKTAVPTIHQYQKYIRPALKALEDDTKSLGKAEDICSIN